MKKISVFLALLFIISAVSGCGGEAVKYELNQADIPTFSKLDEGNYQIIELSFKDNKPIYTEFGEINKGIYRINLKDGIKYIHFTPEYLYNEEFGGHRRTDKYTGNLPDKHSEAIKALENSNTSLEGVVVFSGVPFLFYYNESGEPYVKCLEYVFDKYFRDTDRSYSEFINFAINYKPVKDNNTEEDLLSS